MHGRQCAVRCALSLLTLGQPVLSGFHLKCECTKEPAYVGREDERAVVYVGHLLQTMPDVQVARNFRPASLFNGGTARHGITGDTSH